VSAKSEALRAIREGRGAEVDLRGIRLVGEDLRGCDLCGLDLTGADLSRVDLTGASAIGAVFAHASLTEATLDEAELASADLRGATLERASAMRTGFGQADLSRASLFGVRADHASFVGARLVHADLRSLRARDARFAEADVSHACLSKADLRDADLTKARVRHTSFVETDLRHARLRGLFAFESALFLRADVRDVDWSGAYLIRRHIIDENFLEEFRQRDRLHNLLYWVWWATSDCGRSLARWTGWTAAIAFVFGLLYSFVPLSRPDYESVLTPFYFSLVTLTTLGYGDVAPASEAGQALVMAEVTVGYLMLGGLVSIFSNKLARRGE
jgi:uncharacterized protein YjbI with pentapeptide repeats